MKRKKKILVELNGFKKLGQMCDFAVANRSRFAPDSPAANAVPEVIAAVTTLKTLTASHASVENRLRELSEAKSNARVELREEIEFLYHTARAIAVEKPGFDQPFRLPLVNDARLLHAARSAVQDAASHAAVFVKHAMPADFPEPLNAKIRDFENARQQHETTKKDVRLGQQLLQQSLRQALSAARRFDAIMRNTFRGDPILLEAWKAAGRTRRPARSPKDFSTPDASPPSPVAETA